VKRVQLPVAYVVLAKWDSLHKEAEERRLPWPWPAQRQEFLDWFLAQARAENVTMISEGQSLEAWAAKGGKSR